MTSLTHTNNFDMCPLISYSDQDALNLTKKELTTAIWWTNYAMTTQFLNSLKNIMFSSNFLLLII